MFWGFIFLYLIGQNVNDQAITFEGNSKTQTSTYLFFGLPFRFLFVSNWEVAELDVACSIKGQKATQTNLCLVVDCYRG